LATFPLDLDSLEAFLAAGATTFWNTLSALLTWMASQWRHLPKMELLTYGSKPNCQNTTPAGSGIEI